MYFFVNLYENMGPKIINKTNTTYSYCTSKCLKEAVDGKLQCKCGEDTDVFDWTWQDQQFKNIKMSDEGREVLFHPVYSSGTAVVRGQLPFRQNYHYYWEIKIVSKLYGTDVMIGVGTSKIIFEDWQFKFCSLLGVDSESWGYSYNGFIQHNTLRREYGVPFGLGNIIGVYLDMCNGTLEYFLNRKPLGIAFKNLKGKVLYPMICSTAAQSSLRITCCMSKEPSLQLTSLKHIVSHPGLYQEYRNIPGLSKIYDKQLFWIQPQIAKEVEEKKRMAELDEDVSLSLVDRSYLFKNKRLRAIRLISMLYDQELDHIQNRAQDVRDDVEVYDLCDSDLETTNSHDTDQTGGPSTSGSSSSHFSSNSSISKFHKLCGVCLSKGHESIDCLLKSDLDDSDDTDSDTDTQGLSKIL